MLNIPSQIIIGDTVTWIDNDLRGLDPVTGLSTNYSSDNFILSWFIRGSGFLNLISTTDGLGYRTTITSIQSSGLTSGNYFWQAFVTDTNQNRVNVGSGQIQAIANLANVNNVYDGRTEIEKMLEAVTSAIHARLKGETVFRYEIKGRDLERDPIESLIKFRDQLKIEVSRSKSAEKIAQGLGDPRRLFVRFR